MLKALAIVLNHRIDFPKSCYHVPGKDGEEKRGAKAAVRLVHPAATGHWPCGPPTGPPKMALYSLTGNASSPFHAEPAQI